MHGYVINLARSHDRRSHITGELEKTGLDYEIVTAVDGRELDLSDRSVVDPVLAAAFSSLSAGTVGAALSHLQVYQKVIADGLAQALVLEDDVLVPPNLGNLAESVAEHLTGAEVALLSYDSPTPCQMSRAGAIRLPAGRTLALPIDMRQPRSAGGYVITRVACERLAKIIMPVRIQADGWWYFYREGALDRIRCVTPMPVLKSSNLTSTIGSYSMSHGLMARLAGPVMSHKIPVVHQALAYRRGRIYRRTSQSELVDLPFVEKPSRLD